MRNTFYKGENILVRWSVVDKFSVPVNFTEMTDIIVKVTDRQGNSQTFSKVGGTIVQGVNPNQFQFEITEAMTNIFSAGKLTGRFTYKIPSADHASNLLTDIIEEGVNTDFITLQE